MRFVLPVLLLAMAGCAATPSPTDLDPGTNPSGSSGPGVESGSHGSVLLVDERFVLAPGFPDKLAFSAPAGVHASVLRVVFDTGAHAGFRMSGPGDCNDFSPVGSDASSVQVRSGWGAEMECGPVPAGDHVLSWEGQGYLEGRISLRAWV